MAYLRSVRWQKHLIFAYVETVTHSPFFLAAVTASALHDVEIVATRPPFDTSPDYDIGGALDAQGRHWVVKYPLNPIAGAALEAEASLAPGLIKAIDNGSLPYDVIRPKAFTTVTGGGRAMVYREPYGHPLPLEHLNRQGARTIGNMLGALHELDPQIYASGGVPVYDASGLRERLKTELDDVAYTRKVPGALLGRWDQWMDNDELWLIDTVPVHGDLDEDNVLWADGAITALVGFGEAHVGDPAEDFVWLANSLNDELFDVVTEAYAMARGVGGDAHLLERVVLYSEFALARWLLHGTRIGSAEIVADAQAMLTELDESIAADPEQPSGPRWRVDPTQATPTTSAE